jgi:hypothetical protein
MTTQMTDQELSEQLELFKDFSYENYNKITEQAKTQREKELTYSVFHLNTVIIPGLNEQREKLQIELDKLRDKVALLEEGEKNSKDYDLVVTLSAKEEEIKSLKSDYSFKEVERQKIFIHSQRLLLADQAAEIIDLKMYKEDKEHYVYQLTDRVKQLKLYIRYLEDYRIKDDNYVKLRDMSDQKMDRLQSLLHNRVYRLEEMERAFYKSSGNKYEESSRHWFISDMNELTSKKKWADEVDKREESEDIESD